MCDTHYLGLCFFSHNIEHHEACQPHKLQFFALEHDLHVCVVWEHLNDCCRKGRKKTKQDWCSAPLIHAANVYNNFGCHSF